ncbi:MAG: FUSC family protein [Morganella morganii]
MKPVPLLTRWHLIGREFAPSPGRYKSVFRFLVVNALVIIISMALQVPFLSLSIIMIFFTSRENIVQTWVAGIVMALGGTLGICISLILLKVSFNTPFVRIVLAAIIIFSGMYFFRISKLGVMGFILTILVSYSQSLVDVIPAPEVLVRMMLWAWVAAVYPVVINVIVNVLVFPVRPDASTTPAKPVPFIVADPWTNPAYARFAVKCVLATLLCYLFYSSVDWQGIHTAMLTCVILALPSVGAITHKGMLRITGCVLGGGAALLITVFILPYIDTIVGLLMVSLPVLAISAWIASGSEKTQYVGVQMAFAFALSMFDQFGPTTSLTEIRDRMVGILLGVVVSVFIYSYLWPEDEVRKVI